MRERPAFKQDALALFIELDAVPARARRSDVFKRRDRELARMLGLGFEWMCCVASVTDRGRIYRDDNIAGQGRVRVRAVRAALLEAADRGRRCAG